MRRLRQFFDSKHRQAGWEPVRQDGAGGVAVRGVLRLSFKITECRAAVRADLWPCVRRRGACGSKALDYT